MNDKVKKPWLAMITLIISWKYTNPVIYNFYSYIYLVGDPEPPSDPELEALLQQVQLECAVPDNPIITAHCPAGFAKRNVLISNYFC